MKLSAEQVKKSTKALQVIFESRKPRVVSHLPKRYR